MWEYLRYSLLHPFNLKCLNSTLFATQPLFNWKMWRILQMRLKVIASANRPKLLVHSPPLQRQHLPHCSSNRSRHRTLFPTWWLMNRKWSQEAVMISDVSSQMKQDNTNHHPKKQTGSYFWLNFLLFKESMIKVASIFLFALWMVLWN